MPSARANRSTLMALAATTACLALAGCLAHDPFAPPTDPQSAAAQQVNAAAATDRPYPRWSQFPAAPTEVPTAEQFGVRVADAEEAKAILEAQARDLVWTLEDSEGWAVAARVFIDSELAQPAPPDSRALTEAWAAEVRAKATPPQVAK
jgi:hypothetical protein